MDIQDGTNSQKVNELLEQLHRLTPGRLHVTTQELGRLTGHADQTIRKLHSQTGGFLGLRPVKIGNRLLWSVADIAVLLSHTSKHKNSCKERSVGRYRKIPGRTVYVAVPPLLVDQKELSHD
jgi:hypothetical protein